MKDPAPVYQRSLSPADTCLNLLQGGKDLSEPELARALAHESREAAAVSPGARRS